MGFLTWADGLPLVLIALVLWGAYGLPLKGALRHFTPCVVGAIAFFTAGILLLAWRLLGPAGAARLAAPGSSAWKGIALSLLAGVIAAVAMPVMLRAFELRDIARAVPIINLNTLVAVLGGVLIFGERLSWRGWLGVALATAGAYLVQTGGE